MVSETKVWLITGAGQGLGRALVEAVLDEGDLVVATVRGAHDLPDRPNLLVEQLDVRDRAAAADVVARAGAIFGRLDVLVNCAGHGLVGAVEEVSQDEARTIVDTDLLGPLWLSQAALPIMREQGAGHIVQISTVGAVGSMPTMGLYNAAKWELEGFSEAMAAEVAGFGIRVTVVEPGALATEWAGRSMRFSRPLSAYDGLRTDIFGRPDVPWPAGEPAAGTSAPVAATEIVRHVHDARDTRLRLLVGDDAPGQVREAIRRRESDYERDPRYAST